jgi:hypothetical protein
MYGEGWIRLSFWRTAGLVAIGVLAASASALANQTKDEAPSLESAGGLGELACKNGGREVKLTASRMNKGHRHYIEFRTRPYSGLPTGHMYVVFGELNAEGKVSSRYHIGLLPDGSALGFFGGALVDVPAHVKPGFMECSGGVINAWRISLTASQYEAVTRKARSSLLKPPLWSMFKYNCNHFAAGFGDIVGLNHPRNPGVAATLYLPAYIKANSR